MKHLLRLACAMLLLGIGACGSDSDSNNGNGNGNGNGNNILPPGVDRDTSASDLTSEQAVEICESITANLDEQQMNFESPTVQCTMAYADQLESAPTASECSLSVDACLENYDGPMDPGNGDDGDDCEDVAAQVRECNLPIGTIIGCFEDVIEQMQWYASLVTCDGIEDFAALIEDGTIDPDEGPDFFEDSEHCLTVSQECPDLFDGDDDE